MIIVVALAVFVAAFVVGVVIGSRYTAAAHEIDRLVEAFDRDQQVCDAADMGQDGVL